MTKAEERLQIAISDLIRLQYKDVIFTFEAGGLRLGMGLAKKAKRMRSSRGLPDMLIFEPSKNRQYKALFMELKIKRSDVYLKDGVTLKADKHIKEQAVILARLRAKGYYAEFVFGFDEAVIIIKNYL